jgi:dCMP deaminase
MVCINRPSWDKIWMQMAETIAQRSHHPTFKVGAIIVTSDNTQVLSLGYNGNAKGMSNVPQSDKPGCSGLLHAEINALLKLDYNNPKDKVMYLTLSPCQNCAMAIINSGIKKVIYRDEYRDKSGIDLLEGASIKVSQSILSVKRL